MWLVVGEAAILFGGIMGFINVRRRFGQDPGLRPTMAIGTALVMLLYGFLMWVIAAG